MAEELRGIGDNNPPQDIEAVDPHHLLAIPVDMLRDFLTTKYAHLLERQTDLLASTARWVNEHTHDGVVRIEKNEMDGPATLDFKKQLEEFIGAKGEVMVAKDMVKRDLLDACDIVQGFFVDDVRQPVVERHAIVQQAYTRHLNEVEAARTEAARRATEAATAEAAHLARLAEELPEGATRAAVLGQVEVLTGQINEAVEHLTGSLGERSRERGFSGTSSGLRERWGWELVDKMALIKAVADGKEDAELLQVNAQAVNKIVNVKARRRPITGIKMTRTETAS